MMESVCLEFVWRDSGPVLERSLVRTRDGEAVVAGPRAAVWANRVPRALALLFVRLARWKGIVAERRPALLPLLQGQGKCMAVSLSEVFTKGSQKWLGELMDNQEPPEAAAAARLLRRWFLVANPQGKNRQLLTTISAVLAELPPEAVTIRCDGEVVTGIALDKLERALAALADGSLPPMPAGPGLEVCGYLPSVGPGFSGGGPLLRQINACYANPDSRIILLRGEGGTGKTTTAVEWLAGRCTSGQLAHSLVFSWSFYRQGYGGAGQSMVQFHQALASALRVTLLDSMLPIEVAELLGASLRERPALLFLDGLEVLINGKCPLPGGITDGVLAEVLRRIVGADGSTKVLITSRMPLMPYNAFAYPQLEQVRMKDFARHGRTTTPLEESLAAGQSESAQAAAELLSSLEANAAGDRVPTLVRRVLETLGESPERSLLLAASLFERPPEWEALLALLRSQPPVPRLTEPWADLSDERWDAVLDRLQTMRLVQLDATGSLSLHPLVMESLATGLRSSMPLAWVEGQRRLYAYFAALPEKYEPDTLLELEPLLRALWHGSQAGEYRRVFEEMAFPRISRNQRGYMMNDLGAYEETVRFLESMSPDHLTFPEGCDLLHEQRVMVTLCYGWALMYLDRWEEGYECSQMAYSKLDSRCSAMSVMPLLCQMQQWQYLYGDFAKQGQIRRMLLKSLALAPFAQHKIKLPEEFMTLAVGMSFAMAALSELRSGHPFSARVMSAFGLKLASRLVGHQLHLLPSLGSPWHALLLLELGRWQEVEAGLAKGELDETTKHHREPALPQLIRGRVLSAKAQTLDGSASQALADAALRLLEDGQASVTRFRFRWSICAFQLAIATHCAAFGNAKRARKEAQACFDSAKQHGFKLHVLDAEKLLQQPWNRDQAEA